MAYVSPYEWTPSPGISLSESTKEIITADGHIAIMAGPGSGKTEILAQKASFLLSTGKCPPPKRILAISFKVDAANNIRDRVKRRCDPIFASRFESMTLHAFAKRILDQFREALPEHIRPGPSYSIIIPTRDDIVEFQRSMNDISPVLGSIAHGMTDKNILSLSNALPSEQEPEVNGQARIQYEWWRYLVGMREPKITFDMIFSLAIYIVKNTPVIRSIINQTYKYVFLDEFQDVTTMQYKLITSIFAGSDAIVTAVGDDQQAIMGWAGADAHIYQKLEENFGATPRNLSVNFRSNREIVNLINFLNRSLFSNALEAECARSQDAVPPDAIQRWLFSSRETEGIYLARFIAQTLEDNPKLKQHDFLILTKLRANEVEERMKDPFLQHGLRLRNEARNVGKIAIQDLVGDETFCFILASIKLAKNIRTGNPFQICRDFLANVHGINLTDDRGHTDATSRVRKLVKDLRNVVESAPQEIDGTDILTCVLEHATEDKIKKIIKEYGAGDRFQQIKESFILFFNECSDISSDWENFLSNIEGANQVKLMTIHKSKGLEYHTVIFTELNDDAFWGNEDETKLFFVALSRARERVRFSFVRGQRGFNNVRKFEQLLSQADISTEKIDN